MKIVLYSPVNDNRLFDKVGFYRDDLNALRLDNNDVLATNSIFNLIKFKPDFIVGYFFSKSILAALIGRIISARIVLTGGADQISPRLLSGFPLFIRRFSAFLCLLLAHRVMLSCTDDFKNFSKLCFGFVFLQNKIQLVNHVVIPSPYKGQVRTPVAGQFHAFTICWMGSESNVRRKGVDKAIKLVVKLREIGVDARLDIAGTDGPGKHFLQDLTQELCITDHIHFIGSISEEEKNYHFSHGSVYIQLSEHEGFGVAAAEAFFSGMMVVHSNKGGLSDVIGEYGLVIDPVLFDQVELAWVRDFYDKFLLFRIDQTFLLESISNYSLKMRSDNFFKDFIRR